MNPQPRYQPGDKIGGRYQVHQALMGGMGEVYLCLDLGEMIPLALKTFQQRYLTNPKLRAAFENEVATWVALEKHPNIVRCFYMDILDNQPFMFLEWIASDESRGTDLRSWLRRGPLDLRLALDFTIDICRGLIHAQEKQPGIVHRDLKPENILVAQGRLAKITDLGLAKIVQEAELEITTDAEHETDGRQSLLDLGGIVGTPPYMAPEQWHGEALDARTDIYAIGCILYEMLTGSWPFQATTLDSLRRQHLEAPIPALREDNTGLAALDTLLTRCLAKQRDERFASVDDLLQEFSLIYQRQFSEMPKSISVSEAFTALDHGNRGNTYARLERYEEALADYTRAIQLDPNLAPAYTNRGIAYASLQRYEEALADLNYAIQLDPNYASAYANRGSTYHSLKRYDEALSDHTHAIQLDPNYALAYNNRGNTCRSLQRYDESLADYTQAIELDPTDAKAYYNRGFLYDGLQRYDKALVDYTQAIQLDPNHVPVYNNRGNTYASLQHYDKALADYTRAIQLEPTEALAYYNRGLTYAALQRYDEALTDYTCAIQCDPTDAFVYTSRGHTYANLGRYDEALADYTQAIELDPTLPLAYNNRGHTYASLGRYDEAMDDYTKAIELDPTFALAYANRGHTCALLQHYDEAMADFTRAIQCDPTYALAYRNVGALLVNRGAVREALPYLEKAAQLGDPQGAQYAAQVRQMLHNARSEE